MYVFIILEWLKVLKNAAKIGVGLDTYLRNPTEATDKNSLLVNESRNVILFNQELPKFYTHEKSWRQGHGGKMYAHRDCFYCYLTPYFFLHSLSFYHFRFSLRISYAGPF